MDTVKTRHLGENIRKIRLLRGISQGFLANGLGVTQQNISKMEKKKDISDEQIEKVGKIMKVTTEAIKDFDENTIINNNILNEQVNNYNIHPLDKVTEIYKLLIQSKDEEIKKLKSELEKVKMDLVMPESKDAKPQLRKVSE